MRRAGASRSLAATRARPAPVNSLAGLLGLLGLCPSLRSAGASHPLPPPCRAGPAPPASSGRAPPPQPCLELFIVPAPAEVAARGPAPQEGLQRVQRRPLASRPPPPVLAALLLLLALLMLASLLPRLVFLLGARHSVGGGGGGVPGDQDPAP